MSIRRATIADADTIAAIHVASWAETYANLLPAPVIQARTFEMRQRYWQRMLERLKTVFVAEHNGEAVGFTSGGRERGGPLERGEIHTLYVLRSAQRQGHGKALIDAAFDDFRRMGKTAATVLVLDTNTAARAFYERLGAEFLESIPDLISDGVEVADARYLWRKI